jgi:D-aspartate ligase
MTNNGALILGGHIQALGIIRILGRAGIKCGIIDKTTKNISRHSNYCSEFFVSQDEYLLEFLLNLGNNKKYKDWVIFPTNDFQVKILSKNKSLLEKYFIISTDDWPRIEIFYNKSLAYELARKLGIPIPNTWYPKNEANISNLNLTYPCIIKPAIMHTFYSNVKKKVFVCENYEELIKYYKKALTIITAQEIIIQEIIPGSSKNQYSACFLFLHRKPIVYLSACRLRQHPIDFGNATTYAETNDEPQIREYAEKLLYESNYQGLCEVEFKFDHRDGQYKFLEVNPRTWKWHSIANKAQTPFLLTYYNFLIGKDIQSTVGFKKASFLHFLTDFPIRLLLLIKGFDFWNRKNHPIEYAVWDRNDIKPWIFEKLYLISFLKKR